MDADRFVAGAMTRMRAVLVAIVMFGAVLAAPGQALAQSLPTLTGPVNDFAHVIDPASASEMDRRIRALETTTKDAIVVVTVDSYAPYGSIEDYAAKLFEHAGIGQRSQDNGALIVLAVKERRVRIEVGYGLEEFITDGFSGDTIRQAMLPEFRAGRYGTGLLAGTTRVIQRIAEKRGVTVPNVPAAPARSRDGDEGRFPIAAIIFVVVILMMFLRRGGPRSRGRGWGGPFMGGWMGGIGGFGRGGFGGGSFGGGFGGGGGGFGGFGGGRSGGGGASGGW